MSGSAESKKVVLAYFEAWSSKNTEGAYALLAEGLTFVGPTASYSGRSNFKTALENFAKLSLGTKVLQIVSEGEEVSMLYECELPAPVGKIHIASFFKIKEGKIGYYETLFDTIEFRKLLAKLAPGK